MTAAVGALLFPIRELCRASSFSVKRLVKKSLHLSASLMLTRARATRKAKPARVRAVAPTISFQFFDPLEMVEDDGGPFTLVEVATGGGEFCVGDSVDEACTTSAKSPRVENKQIFGKEAKLLTKIDPFEAKKAQRAFEIESAANMGRLMLMEVWGEREMLAETEGFREVEFDAELMMPTIGPPN